MRGEAHSRDRAIFGDQDHQIARLATLVGGKGFCHILVTVDLGEFVNYKGPRKAHALEGADELGRTNICCKNGLIIGLAKLEQFGAGAGIGEVPVAVGTGIRAIGDIAGGVRHRHARAIGGGA